MVVQMTTSLNTAAPEKREPPWTRITQFLLVFAFVVIVYLLGLSMVHHRFFRGSRIDRYGHVRQ